MLLAQGDGLNRRRHELIDREMGGGLTPGEEAELRILEGEVDGYLDAVEPLPSGILDELGACAARDGLEVLDGLAVDGR